MSAEDLGSAPTGHVEVVRPHYYGDVVRKLLIFAGLFMLITLPFFSGRIPLHVWGSLFAVLIVIFLSGLTNPRQAWIFVLNVIISMLGVILFEYYAVLAYRIEGVDLFFVSNQTLTLIFFFALYYSTKTIRWMFTEHTPDNTGS